MTAQEPELQKPGAGIPAPERAFFRYIAMPVASGWLSWGYWENDLKAQTKALLKVYRTIPSHISNQKILVSRLPGLEDSSRYWSANMVLEHIIIVTKGIAGIIEILAQEKQPTIEVRTQDVKPTGALKDNVASVFETEMDLVYSRLSAFKNKCSKARHYHPWFGQMNSKKWFTLLPLHHRIHLKQLSAIEKALAHQP